MVYLQVELKSVWIVVDSQVKFKPVRILVDLQVVECEPILSLVDSQVEF